VLGALDLAANMYEEQRQQEAEARRMQWQTRNDPEFHNRLVQQWAQQCSQPGANCG
jgi:hypothetical protein